MKDDPVYAAARALIDTAYANGSWSLEDEIDALATALHQGEWETNRISAVGKAEIAKVTGTAPALAALPTMSGDYVMVPREVLVRARNLAMDRTVRAPTPECAHFGAIAQDLDAMLYSASPTGGE